MDTELYLGRCVDARAKMDPSLINIRLEPASIQSCLYECSIHLPEDLLIQGQRYCYSPSEPLSPASIQYRLAKTMVTEASLVHS